MCWGVWIECWSIKISVEVCLMDIECLECSLENWDVISVERLCVLRCVLRCLD